MSHEQDPIERNQALRVADRAERSGTQFSSLAEALAYGLSALAATAVVAGLIHLINN